MFFILSTAIGALGAAPYPSVLRRCRRQQGGMQAYILEHATMLGLDALQMGGQDALSRDAWAWSNADAAMR